MKIAIYDATENAPIGWSWAAGARYYKMRGFVQHVVAARDWGDGLRACIALAKKHSIDEIQFWGHGSPGKLLINRAALDVDEHRMLLAALGEVLTPDALIWFRTCSAFAGVAGRALATRLAAAVDRRVAGSTYIIGFPWHSGQHSLRPGGIPAWSVSEGLDGTGQPVKSSKTAPHTISFSTRALPSSW